MLCFNNLQKHCTMLLSNLRGQFIIDSRIFPKYTYFVIVLFVYIYVSNVLILFMYLVYSGEKMVDIKIDIVYSNRSCFFLFVIMKGK